MTQIHKQNIKKVVAAPLDIKKIKDNLASLIKNSYLSKMAV